jgi:hypothetical protein
MVHNIYLPLVDCFEGYVLPRSRKINRKIESEFLAAKVTYSVAPASLILFISRLVFYPFVS